jgi:hypothetical protein
MRNGIRICKPTGSPAIVVAGSGSQTASIVGQGSVEFANASSLSLNGVFTSDYDNYMIVVTHKGSTADNAYNLRLRASGVDSTSGHIHQYLQASGTSIVGARLVSQSSARLSSHSSNGEAGLVAYIYGPNLAQPTAYRTITIETIGSPRILDFAGTHGISSSYDGVTLFADSGSTTGIVAVYGLVD